LNSQDKKKWLKRYGALNKEINQKLGELERQKALCMKITTVFSDMPKGGSKTREDSYIRMIEMDEELNKSVDGYVDMRHEIEATINKIEDSTLRTLLRYRYIDGAKWEQIAVDMNYDYSWVLRLHGSALNALKISE